MSDEDPLGGRPRSRLVLIVGLLFAAAIAAFLVWFMASNTETRDSAGGPFGPAGAPPAVLTAA